MAFDNLTKRELHQQARTAINGVENLAQYAMRRLDELERRDAAAGSAPGAEPSPTPTPTEGFADFRFEDWVNPAGAHTDNESYPDGAFRLTANVAKYGAFDPIVHPGQDKAGHLHMFWGNVLVDGQSTHASLIAAGHGTAQGDMVNRSSYWMPALLFGDTIWGPDYISNYYKMLSAKHKNHPRGIAKQAPMPAGLQMVFGNLMMPTEPSPHVEFRIFWDGGQVKSNVFADVLPEFKAGRQFAIAINAPNCWNGELDSADHRSHLAYAEWNGAGYFESPATHPIMIPHISYIPAWTIPEGIDLGTLRCSSDMPGMAPLHNVHADFMDGWHPTAAKAWFDHALMRQLNCSSCDFGNGQMGKRPAGFTFEQRPNLIPIAHSETGHIH